MILLLSLIGAVAGIVTFVGFVWTLIIAFQSGDIIWGVVGIFCGIVTLVYAIMHMDKCKQPLMLMGGGIAVAVVANILKLALTS